MVQIRLVGRLAPTRSDAENHNATDAPVFQQADCCWLQVGARDVVPAVEMAVRFMRVGETAVVWTHSKYAYGLAGRRHRQRPSNSDNGNDDTFFELPAESNVAYEITVLRRVPNMDTVAQVIALATARKEQANDMYANEWAKGAGKSRVKLAYERIVKDMDALLVNSQHDDQFTTDLQEAAQALRIDALNNITAVLLRCKEYHDAKAAAVKVLELEPNNYKALIRAAKAALMDPSSEFHEVEMALQAAAAQSVDGTSVRDDIAKLQQDFVRRKQAYDMASKQMFKTAFDGNKKADSNDDGNRDDVDSKTTAATADKSIPAAETKEAPASNGEATTTTTTATKEPINWRYLLWQYILPYGFQLILPFLMWHVAQQYRISPEEMEARKNMKDEF